MQRLRSSRQLRSLLEGDSQRVLDLLRAPGGEACGAIAGNAGLRLLGAGGMRLGGVMPRLFGTLAGRGGRAMPTGTAARLLTREGRQVGAQSALLGPCWRAGMAMTVTAAAACRAAPSASIPAPAYRPAGRGAAVPALL